MCYPPQIDSVVLVFGKMTSSISTEPIEIHLANTQGFCAGVSMAIETVEQALQKYGSPIYVRHEIVHNTSVIRDFEERGVVFVEDLAEVPEGQTVIFSAHGVAPEVYQKAKDVNLISIDATCPLVTKVHREAEQFTKKGIQTILVGHKGHQELIGTSGYVDPTLLHVIETADEVDQLEIDPDRPVGYLTQTTLSVTETRVIIERLKSRFPEIVAPPKEDICYATQNRQDAVTELANRCDVVIICGSPTSSNSNRLRETAAAQGVPSYIIDTEAEFTPSMIAGYFKIGISSGASVPSYVVENLVTRIQGQYPNAKVFREESREKDVKFRVPKI